jgi:hypothetical protein
MAREMMLNKIPTKRGTNPGPGFPTVPTGRCRDPMIIKALHSNQNNPLIKSYLFVFMDCDHVA